MERLDKAASDLRAKRIQILETIRANGLPPGGRGRSEELGEKRAELIIGIEELRKRAAGVTERIVEVRTYKETSMESSSVWVD